MNFSFSREYDAEANVRARQPAESPRKSSVGIASKVRPFAGAAAVVTDETRLLPLNRTRRLVRQIVENGRDIRNFEQADGQNL